MDQTSTDALCDICSKPIAKYEGYMLITFEIVSEPNYWKRYFEIHKAQFDILGITSYMQFIQSPDKWLPVARIIAAQINPWMVCDNCIDLFEKVDRKNSRFFAKAWWISKGTLPPIGSGPSSINYVDLGEGMIFPPSQQHETKKWWQFWKQ
jgi:hypothetical protein